MDPSAFGTFNLGNIVQQAEQIRASQARRQQVEQEAQQKRRLGELLPQVMGGGMSEGGAVPGRQAAMQELASIDPDLFMKLDDRQREQAKAEASELVNAVQWADTPEKWAQAQQYLGSKGMDVSGYGFDQREQYLLQAGKIGQLLESRPKPTADPSSVREYDYARQQGFGGSYMDYVKTRYPGAPVVLGPYDTMEGGGAPAPQAPARVPTVSDTASYDALPPGTQYRDPQGNLRTKGGQSGSAPAGGFPPSGS